MAKGPIFDIPGARIELVDGGLYRDSGGQLKEYSGGLKISSIKNGKISCSDFLTLLKSLDSTKGRAFLSEIERRAALENPPVEVANTEGTKK